MRLAEDDSSPLRSLMQVTLGYSDVMKFVIEIIVGETAPKVFLRCFDAKKRAKLTVMM